MNIPNRGGASGPPDGGSLDANGDAGGIVEDAEAGTCGLEQELASGSRVFPSCGSCISASVCCAAESFCAGNADCAAIVGCVAGAGCTDSVCVGNCELGRSNGTDDFVQFANCVTQNCASPQCPFLSPTGDR